jgi:UDPglucose 6-dehydrogenase
MDYIKVGIVGSGTVGKATGQALIRKGHYVHFMDIQNQIVSSLQATGYNASLPENAPPTDITFLCVPTPTVDDKADYTFLNSACIDLGKRMRRDENQLVVIKSTVLPGTTETLVIPCLEEASGLKAGKDFGICVCPEYLREKSAISDAMNPRVIVIGEHDLRSGQILAEFLSSFSCQIIRMPIRYAEMQKLVHNIFNAVKISFFNEVREIAEVEGIECDLVFEAVALSSEGMWNPRYGVRDFGAFGGSCLPKDCDSFLHWSKERLHNVHILSAVLEQNNRIRKRGKEKGSISIVQEGAFQSIKGELTGSTMNSVDQLNASAVKHKSSKKQLTP